MSLTNAQTTRRRGRRTTGLSWRYRQINGPRHRTLLVPAVRLTRSSSTRSSPRCRRRQQNRPRERRPSHHSRRRFHSRLRHRHHHRRLPSLLRRRRQLPCPRLRPKSHRRRQTNPKGKTPRKVSLCRPITPRRAKSSSTSRTRLRLEMTKKMTDVPLSDGRTGKDRNASLSI